MSKLSTALDAIRARLGEERKAQDWGSVAASEQELRHVEGELSSARAAEAERHALAEAKRKADASKQAWADALQDADDLRAEWSEWVAEMEQIDARLDAMASGRKAMDAKALELYKRGSDIRGEPIIVAFAIPPRLAECQLHRVPMVR